MKDIRLSSTTNNVRNTLNYLPGPRVRILERSILKGDPQQGYGTLGTFVPHNLFAQVIPVRLQMAHSVTWIVSPLVLSASCLSMYTSNIYKRHLTSFCLNNKCCV